MRRRHDRWWIWVASVLLFAVGLSFVAAAVLAEGALHPLVRRRQSCGCFSDFVVTRDDLVIDAKRFEVGLTAINLFPLAAAQVVLIRAALRLSHKV